MGKLDTCKTCGNVKPLLAVLAGDPFCKALCARDAFGVTEGTACSVYAGEIYSPNQGEMGSYHGRSSGLPTRKQRMAAARDRLAREALGIS